MSSRESSPARAAARSQSGSPASSRASSRSRRSASRSPRSGSRSSRSRSRSRSFSSSSSSSPRFVSATDSENEKKSGDESPKRKVHRHKKSPRQSNDDGSDSEAEAVPKVVSKKRPKRGAKKKASTAATAAAEEGEISDADSNKEFDDGLDEDLIGDEADRARLEKMTEREREEELFKRAENREALKKRFEIQKKLKQQQKLKKEARDSSEDDEDLYNNVQDTKERSQDRRKKVEDKKFDTKSSALMELKAKRQEREQRREVEQKKEAAKGSGDGHLKSRKETTHRARSSSSSSSGSDRSRRRSSSSSSRSSSSGSDTERFKKSPSKVQKYIETQEDLEPIRLSRYKLERFVYLPFFKTLVMNCYVRIGIGQHNGRPVYRAAEIVDVVETGKIYNVGSVRTNTGLRLKFGKEERVFRLEFISNQRIMPQEFTRWKEACEKAAIALPTVEFVKQKSHDVKKALNYQYTGIKKLSGFGDCFLRFLFIFFSDDDVDKVVAQKERFSRHPRNYAMHKARLMKEKEIAIATGDEQRAHELEQKLNEHEERAEELDKKRTSAISSVSLINDRNRKANVSKAEAAIKLEIKNKAEQGVQSNPFTRRKCNPRMVTKVTVRNAAEALKSGQKENKITIEDTTVTVAKRKVDTVDDDEDAAANANPEEEGGSNPAKAKKPKLPFIPTPQDDDDIYGAHDFDIDIALDTPAPMAPASVNMKAVGLGGAKEGGEKRSLNLDDYKKKRGLI